MRPADAGATPTQGEITPGRPGWPPSWAQQGPTAAGLLAAGALTAVALPSLAARALGGSAPGPWPRLAALAPVAAVPAIAGAAVAGAAVGAGSHARPATRSGWWWLALALPAAALVAWQAPPPRPVRCPGCGRSHPARSHPARAHLAHSHLAHSHPARTLRVLTLNMQGGRASSTAVVRQLRRHRVDVLAAQELTQSMAQRLADAGVGEVLPHHHLDPRPGSRGSGLWSRWPLSPLLPVPGLICAAPRARIDPWGGMPVTLAAVHPMAPMKHREGLWQRELAAIQAAVATGGGAAVVAGDFNATRDHRPFRDILGAGFLDCADAARHRPWPGFTWPADRAVPPMMRLDHVLVRGPEVTVHWARTVEVPGTDHRGVLAVIDFGTG